jgi:hypothetical protein
VSVPISRPNEDAAALWRLQGELMALAEALLGTRDSAKQICQPVFSERGPCMCNTPALEGAFAELSLNAAGYWPTAIFELAHETVHLLNPTVQHTNWLEEGVAVAFSLHALRHYDLPPQHIALATYREAHELAEALPGGTFAAAKAVRAMAGALNAVNLTHLQVVAPKHDRTQLERLASRCVPR